MADSVTGSGKGFSRVVQRTVFRTKEKVLQNLGKADKTRDDQFDRSLELFNEQQSAAMKFQKELRRYIMSLKEMNIASQSMYRTLKETYEQDWLGYTIVASAFENHCILWEDYLTKMTDVQNSINGYSESFPEIGFAKLAKRGRKLTDYDSARHTHEALMNTRRRDQAKITKALDELNEAKSVYELINDELCEELPTFFNSRIAVLASIFNQLCSAEIVFQEESVKVKNSINEVAERLVSDNSQTSQPSQPRNVVSVSNETRRSLPTEQPLKLNNARYPTQLSLFSQTEPSSNAKQSNVASSHSTQPLSLLPNMLPKSQSKDSNTADGFPLNFLEDSCVKAESPSATSPSKDLLDHSSDDERNDSNCMSAAASSTQHEEGIYSLARAYDDDDDDTAEYAVPRPIVSNTPAVNRPSVVPSERILFKVQATHAYEGEDVDELSFEPGEIIVVVPYENPDEQDDGWLMGVKESTREKGVFPENFTARI